jgi:hypothetical protein
MDGIRVGTTSNTRSVAMTAQRLSTRQANDEPSLGMSIGVLCVMVLAIVAIVANVSVPDVQFAPADLLAVL